MGHMSMEQPSKEKRKRSGVLEAAAVATALLGAIDREPAHALDLPPETPWAVGVQKNLRNAVMNERNESQTTFLMLSDGTTVWPAVQEGKETSVVYTIANEFNYVVKNHRGEQIEARCSIHTHPFAYKMEGPFGKMYSLPYNPPSDLDIRAAGMDKDYERFYSLAKMKVKKNVFASADSKGLWYYGASPANFAKEDSGAWDKAFSKFVHQSIFDKNFEFTVEYPKLQEAYRKNLGAEIRFVPYEQVSQEPVCAGVDYKAAKSVALGK